MFKLPKPASAVQFVKDFFRHAPMYLTPHATQAAAFTVDGAQANAAGLAVTLGQLAANSMGMAGGGATVNPQAAAFTLSNLSNTLNVAGAGSAQTCTLDYAYNIVNNLPKPLSLGQTFGFAIMCTAASTVASATLSDSAITYSGTMTVATASIRQFQGTVTQLNSTSSVTFTPGTTFTSLTQVGSTNAFTMALGTNVVVPTVGQICYVTVTAGTLPSGWYPIVKVTSATSFVIGTPLGTTWTMTAGSVGSTATPPPTYSPLITIVGLYQLTSALS